MLHCRYLRHLKKYTTQFASNSEFRHMLDHHRKEPAIMADINLDPVIGVLHRL